MRQLKIQSTTGTIPVGKMLCLGKNYEKHAKEMGGEVPPDPVIFLKPSTALVGNGGTVLIPAISDDLHHEVELVVVVGSTARDVAPEQAMDHILGYAVGLDMTLRDVQSVAKQRGEPWAVAKGFDTSAPIGDIVPKERVPDPHNLMLKLTVNGQVRQHGATAAMILKIPYIISYLSRIYTLEPGDCIFTGTPEGVSRVQPGDMLVAEIEGLATLSVGVGRR
ncbi:MAG: fumarylacetoacetate hydrolase family protein [Armatimonadetes bacterium]|nr:fumarylacetoacetate hydrolase family protein [Armatimonadota bacterium]